MYHYLDLPDVAILVPIVDKKFLVISQKREPINKVNFEFPCGWIDLNEKPAKSAARELYEETQLKGVVKSIVGTTSHFNTIFGDVLLIGLIVEIYDWSTLKAGDDISEASLFDIEKLPDL